MSGFTLSALKSELLNDPAVVGYSAPMALGDTRSVADLINAIQASIIVRRPDISSQEILEAVDVRDLPAAVSPSMSWFESATQQVILRLLADDGSDTRVLGNLKRILTNVQGSQTRLINISTRSGSRAEQLWGTGFVVTPEQCADAIYRT